MYGQLKKSLMGGGRVIILCIIMSIGLKPYSKMQSTLGYFWKTTVLQTSKKATTVFYELKVISGRETQAIHKHLRRYFLV